MIVDLRSDTVTRPSVGMARVLGDYAATRKKDGLHTGVAFLTADATDTKNWIKRAVGALPRNVPLGIAEDIGDNLPGQLAHPFKAWFGKVGRSPETAP